MLGRADSPTGTRNISTELLARLTALSEHDEQSVKYTSAVGAGASPAKSGSSDLHPVYSRLVGQTVDHRFRILELLGHGGMAAVYHVRDTRPDPAQDPNGRFRSADDEYALKVYLPRPAEIALGPAAYVSDGTSGCSGAQRFVREFRMGQRKLSETGRVAKAFHFGSAEVLLGTDTALGATSRPAGGAKGSRASGSHVTVYYFSMDLVRGGSLPEVTEPQPVEMVAALALELFSALDDLHSRNVVHRDLALGNVLLTDSWHGVRGALRRGGAPGGVAFPKVILADLGIAKHGALRNDNPLGQVLGTAAFLAPESFVLGNLDPRVDLYAAGVILYWLATGRHPLEAAGYDIRHLLCGESCPLRAVRDLVPTFPVELDSAIMALLEREPARRSTTAALAHDIVVSWWNEKPRQLSLPETHPLQGRPYLCQPRFVGRSRELDRARGFLDQTLCYRPPEELTKDDLPSDHHALAATRLPSSVLTISGPPGVGKSRLLAEIAHLLAEETKAVVLRGRCLSSGGVALQSLAPVLDALARLEVASRAGRRLAAASSLADGSAIDRPAGALVGEGYERRCMRLERIPSEQEPEYAILSHQARSPDDRRAQAELRRRFLMAQAAARLLHVARSRPIVIMQEDSQWSDESSIAMLEYLLQGVALARAVGHPARVAFILTHRQLDADNGVGRLLSVLGKQSELERPAVRIDLEGMTRGEVTELCSSLLQTPESPALTRFSEALFDRSATRPLYVEQVLRTLLEDGLLTRGTFTVRPDGARRWTGSWNLDPALAMAAPMPTNVHEAIGRNVEQLSSGTAKALMFAAAEGREFELELVARAAGFEPLECLDFLDEATGAGFVNDVEQLDLAASASHTCGRCFAFRHDRFREAVYGASPEDTRKRCHARLAEAILELRGEIPEVAESLARHFAGSGRPDKAYVQLAMAADHAMSSHAYDHAVELYRQAFVLAEAAGLAPSSSLRDALARASISAGFYDLAAEHLASLGDDDRLSSRERWEASLRLAELKHRQQDYLNAVPPLEEVLRAMGECLPTSRFGRKLAFVRRIVPVLLCGWWPKLVNMRPAPDQSFSEARARAWYTLGESKFFIDFGDCLFMAAFVGHAAVSEGLNGFSPASFAALALGFSGGGQLRLAHTYAELARKSLALADSGLDGLRVPEPAVRAMANMHRQTGLMLGGELGEPHRKELEACVRDGVRAAKECGDPQRLWLTLVIASFAHLQMGHLRSFQRLLEYLSEQATASRLWYLARVYQGELEALTALAHRSYAEALGAAERSARLAEVKGSFTEAYAVRTYGYWPLALSLSDHSQQTIDTLSSSALETAKVWLERRLINPAAWPLSRCLASLALCQQQRRGRSTTPAAVRALRRACRRTCLGNRVETPLYLGACAALDLLDGKPGKAEKGFAEAIVTSNRQGAIAQLVDVYRLAARVYPEGSRERTMYTWLDDRLTELVIDAATPTLSELLEGAQGPVIQPPLPEDYGSGVPA